MKLGNRGFTLNFGKNEIKLPLDAKILKIDRNKGETSKIDVEVFFEYSSEEERVFGLLAINPYEEILPDCRFITTFTVMDYSRYRVSHYLGIFEIMNRSIFE